MPSLKKTKKRKKKNGRDTLSFSLSDSSRVYGLTLNWISTLRTSL